MNKNGKWFTLIAERVQEEVKELKTQFEQYFTS